MKNRALGAASLLLLVGIAALPAGAEAQEPWEGWLGPPSDGMYGVRFGMDRFTVDRAWRQYGLKEASARAGTMRHIGKVDGRNAEVVCLFREDASGNVGGRLYRIQVSWQDLKVSSAAAIRFFEKKDRELEARYGFSLMSQDAGSSGLATARGAYIRLYQGPQMQAILELKAPRPERYDMMLILDYPQLHPALPGYGNPDS